MADTFTTSLRLQLQTTGGNAGTWGSIADTQYQLLEAAITGDNGYAGGAGGISLTGLTTYSLTVANGTTDQSRQLLYPFVGVLPGACTVTIPGVVKIGWAANLTTGGFGVALTTGSGMPLVLGPGSGWVLFYCDGVNVVPVPASFGNQVNANAGARFDKYGNLTVAWDPTSGFGGNGTFGATLTGYWVATSVQASVSAAGTNIATATALTSQLVFISAASAGQGVVLNNVTPFDAVTEIVNYTAQVVNLYPPNDSVSTLNGAAIAAPTQIPALVNGAPGVVRVVRLAGTSWYSWVVSSPYYVSEPVQGGVNAAGSSIGTATTITGQRVSMASAAATAGVVLAASTYPIGTAVKLYNFGPAAAILYPPNDGSSTLNGILAGGAVIPAPVGAQVGILSATKLSNTIWLTG